MKGIGKVLAYKRPRPGAEGKEKLAPGATGRESLKVKEKVEDPRGAARAVTGGGNLRRAGE